MTGTTASPPGSFPSSPSFKAHRGSRSSSTTSRPSLSLDMTNLPPLSQPTPPSNTLLITGLHDLLVFQPASLDAIRNQITAVAQLNSFSPLPSLRRIICSFLSEADAIEIRKLLDGQFLMNRQGARAKIYFGEPTPLIDDASRPQLLQAPHSDKLFFISPPPSPPHGWVMRTEDPPNKEVHASDLANALAQLKTDQSSPFNDAPVAVAAADPDTPMSLSSDKRTPSWPTNVSQQRSRSSTLIYHPEDHGGTPDLPAVMVEDTTAAPDEDSDMEMSPIDLPVKKMPPKTSRPPVELME